MKFSGRTHFIFLFGTILCSILYYSVDAQQWEPLGPFTTPAILNSNDRNLKVANGIGRVSCIRFIKNKKSLNFYLGSPYGGLFESSDEGKNWKELPLGNPPAIGISDVVIHPKKKKILFVLTGDPDCMLDPNNPALGSESCQSGGIIKSIDGGKTWSDSAIGQWHDTTGKVINDFWKFPSLKTMRRLLIDPGNPDKMFTVVLTYNFSTRTIDGFVYHSDDGGENWFIAFYKKDSYLRDIRFMPGKPSVIYVMGRTVYRSTDSGINWISLQQNGLLPDSLLTRCEISLTEKHPRNIFLLAVNRKNNQNEIYFSPDMGNTFSKVGSGSRSPEWRTSLAVDPIDTTRIYFTTGNKISCYINDGKNYSLSFTVSSIHDDIHEITINEKSGKIYASTDGGLYVSVDKGKTWSGLSNGLNVAECWSVSVSQNGPLKILSGLQDCGTVLYSVDSTGKNSWKTIRGGDGTCSAIDPKIDSLFYYSDGNNKIFSRSNNNGVTWSGNLGVMKPCTYQHPFILQPLNSSSVYIAYNDLYKSENKGEKFAKLGMTEVEDKNNSIAAICVSPSDSNIIYIGYSNPTWDHAIRDKMFISRDGGQTWKDITAGLNGVINLNITSIAVDPRNPEIVYVGFHGAGYIKLMKSEGGGSNGSWVDYSQGLPREADIYTLLFDHDEQSTLFAGTLRGVWQRDKISNEWKITGTGLSSSMISDLDIRFVDHELYAGTHGRGIWKIKLGVP